jgi:hypothetical protein
MCGLGSLPLDFERKHKFLSGLILNLFYFVYFEHITCILLIAHSLIGNVTSSAHVEYFFWG